MAAAQQACEFCVHVCSRPSNGFLVTRSYCICQTTVNKPVNQSEHKEIMQLVLRVGRCANSRNGGKCIAGINDCGKNGVTWDKSLLSQVTPFFPQSFIPAIHFPLSGKAFSSFWAQAE